MIRFLRSELRFAAVIFVLAICTPAYAAEATNAVLGAAIDYLKNHIAMEILSRGDCGRTIASDQSPGGFGTAAFLKEVSDYLSADEVDRLNRWLLSDEYQSLLIATSHAVYGIIGVGRPDPSRCTSAVNKYESAFSQAKDRFFALRPAKIGCGASQSGQGACGSQNAPPVEGNSDIENSNVENSNIEDPKVETPQVENSNVKGSKVENSNVENSNIQEENSN